MNPNAGGPCQGIRNSIPELEKLGNENEVVCLDGPNEKFGCDDSFVIHRLGPAHGRWAKSNALVPWLDEHLPDYDAVILHGLWLYQSHAVTKAVRKLRTGGVSRVPKFFVMPHGMLDPWFQRDPSRRLKAIRNWFVWKLVEQRTIASADGVLFTCQRELQLARETFRPYRPQREINVGYGVPEPPAYTNAMTKAFEASVPKLNNRPYMLFLSRIHPKKGVDILLKAYKQLVHEANNARDLPALVIAGPLDSEYAFAMQRLAADLKTPNVLFLGMLQGDAKWGALYGSEAFVLPSHQENFGIAVVEALACGKPVLISDQVNIWREIEDAGAGLVRPDTLNGTCELLTRFGNVSPQDKKQMAVSARNCFKQHFDIQAAAKSMMNAIGNGGVNEVEQSAVDQLGA